MTKRMSDKVIERPSDEGRAFAALRPDHCRDCVKKRLVFSFLIFTLSNCQSDRTVQPAFYHWQTEFALSDVEKNYLDSLNVKKLYVKFFDVDWDERRKMPVPVASVEITKLGNYEIVPCIFITNRTFQNITEDKIEWFCWRVKEKLFELKPANIIFHEIQFDCDWTANTRERYFKFLQIFKEIVKDTQPEVCATVRLHQLRDYKETGIPPVDRGMLMFYNTGDVESWEEENSILNLKIAAAYLIPNTKYQIPLDVALPIFSWGVLFRDGKMIRLINNLKASDLQDTTRFLKMAHHRFEIIKSTYANGYYLYEKDVIRTEAVDTILLTKAVDLLKNRTKNRNLTLSFYHLDTATIKDFPHEFLENITRTLQ